MNDIAGIHWQVAQATSIQNVVFFGSKAADKSHMGICVYPVYPRPSIWDPN